jgi:tRNA U34 2-thiouridine synthase MnmA/TrmU
MKKTEALALLSGGLDSTLAVKLVLDQGIDVEAVNFVSPFCLCGKTGCGATRVAHELGIPLKTISVGSDYLRMVRNPKHGYGKNMNPCIDCRIFMLQIARRYARQTKASFIFTGEVLDERPMSQHYRALKTIEREAGLEGKILRPLSAKLLPETIPEKKGYVDRGRLLAIRGRSRKKQIQLAQQFNITDYPCPAGGCLLTYREFALKLKDLFTHKKRVTLKDVNLLKKGRHFRHEKNKIIVGRNQAENNALTQMKARGDFYFEVPGCGSPVTILQGPKTRKAILKAAALTAHYSDNRDPEVTVNYGRDSLSKSVIVMPMSQREAETLRIT